MGHAHVHQDGHGHTHDRAGARGLAVALALTCSIFAVQVAGGLIGGSLALLADAGHLLTDASSLILALLAVRMAARPPSGRHTFGWQRAEILAALVNGGALVAIALVTVWAAARRLGDPPNVDGAITLIVAAVGLAANLGAAAVLMRSGEGLNVRAALGHVLADTASSVGVIAAAAIIVATGWNEADPIASLGIAALILVGGIRIVREAIDVLMEAAPPDVDVAEMGNAIARVEGVSEVHDLHVWTVTSGFPAVAAHITVRADAEPWLIRTRTAEMLRRHFAVEHTTLQVEREGEEGRLHQISSPKGRSPDGWRSR
jgi:cobalt-zinc-cadmium efflux system protein